MRIDASIMLAPQLDDDAAKDRRIDRRVERDVAARAGAQLLLERRDLVVVERVSGE